MRLLQSLTLFGVVVFAYFPALVGGFVWDDVDIYIVDNKLLHEPDGIRRFWLTTEPPDYYPFTYTTFWIEHKFFGLNSVGYHVVNLTLHLAVCLLVWRLSKRLGVAHPWAASLLFAVHPVAVESVAWISQRKTLLPTLLGLLSALSHLNAMESNRRQPKVMSLFWYVLSLTARPSLIGLPILYFLYDWIGRRTSPGKALVRVVPFIAAAAAGGVLGWCFQHYRAVGDAFVREQSFLERLATAAFAASFYLRQSFWPAVVCFIYPRWNITLEDWRVWLAVAAWPAAFGMAFRFDRRRTFAALTAFLVLLAPALGLVDIYFWIYSYVADHYQYAALIPCMMWLASWKPRIGWLRAGCIAGAFCLAVWWTLFARNASAVYVSEESVWRDVLRKNPTAWIAHGNLTDLMLAQGEPEKALQHDLQRQRLTAPETTRHYNLAEAAFQRGDLVEAERRLRHALILNPAHEPSNRRLAFLLADRGEWAKALEFAKRVRKPDSELADLMAKCRAAVTR